MAIGFLEHLLWQSQSLKKRECANTINNINNISFFEIGLGIQFFKYCDRVNVMFQVKMLFLNCSLITKDT